MEKNKITFFILLAALFLAGGMFFNLLKASKALSYFSSDPKACINCHVMNTQYASWQHSSHARKATCVDCHLPVGNGFDKYLAKARDGFNHTYAFTAGTYKHAIQISQDGEKRVLKNCIRCHATLVSNLNANEESNHSFQNKKTNRNCWDCHREVPHGKARGLTSVPYNLGVKEIK